MLQKLSCSQILEITKGTCEQDCPKTLISQIAIDSRQVLNPGSTLFVALRGAKADGTAFIPELINLGVRVFLVPEYYQSQAASEVCLIKVPNTRKALQNLAGFERNQFKNPVISVTGSNGKTIVKEWLGQILSQEYAVAKSPKSYNSQVGVPLSIFGIEEYHQVAVLEAGVSKSGEMEALQEMIHPSLGIFTNIGTAHQEGFESLQEKLREKISLFKNSRLVIYCKDQEQTAKVIEEKLPSDKLIAWSDLPGADFSRSLKKELHSTRIILLKNDLSTFTFQVPFTDRASLENITHVIVAAITLGQSVESIQTGIQNLKAVEMRLTLKAGVNDSLLIDDTYNNDLAGLKVALDFMQQQRPKNRRILILSDFLQQGDPNPLYREVAELTERYAINLVIGVGTQISLLESLTKIAFKRYGTTEEFIRKLEPDSFQNDLILITGARVFGFEEVVNRLQQMVHGTTLEINLNSLTHNYNFFKKLISPQTKVMIMVKAFAYGGGAVEIANLVQTMGADYLGVAFSDEGIALRKQGITLPIMVLNPMMESFALCSEYELEPVVFSLEFFQNLASWCSAHQKQMKIHLDLDTGMHRLGFEPKHIPALNQLISENPQLKIASIYTHLVGADEEIHREYTLHQLGTFEKMKDEILSNLTYHPLIHALNSAGIVSFSDWQFDMVRMGIGLYGVDLTGNYNSNLRTISTLKTTISQVKEIPAGETVGYSRKGKLEKGGKIATLAIGYADGYDRRFGNGKGYVLIHGQKAHVVGNVCMDMCMVDVTGLEVKPGDVAIVYGEKIPLIELAKLIGTIPYELHTNISTRVKRVYYLD